MASPEARLFLSGTALHRALDEGDGSRLGRAVRGAGSARASRRNRLEPGPRIRSSIWYPRRAAALGGQTGGARACAPSLNRSFSNPAPAIDEGLETRLFRAFGVRGEGRSWPRHRLILFRETRESTLRRLALSQVGPRSVGLDLAASSRSAEALPCFGGTGVGRCLAIHRRLHLGDHFTLVPPGRAHYRPPE
jgi:hypothetical protein